MTGGLFSSLGRDRAERRSARGRERGIATVLVVVTLLLVASWLPFGLSTGTHPPRGVADRPVAPRPAAVPMALGSVGAVGGVDRSFPAVPETEIAAAAPLAGGLSVALSASPGRGVAPVSVTFTANATSVAHATTFNFSWNFSDGSPLDNVSFTVAAGAIAVSGVSHVFLSVGKFSVGVRVTDNASETPVTIHTTITTAAALTARASITHSVLDVGQKTSILLVLSGGFTPYSFNWTSTDPTNASCVRSGFYYNCTPKEPSPAYVASLVVVDALGDVASLNVAFSVAPALLARGFVQTYFQCVGSVGLLSANFSGSILGGTTPTVYHWSFGDGTLNSTSLNTTHSYPLGPTYLATFVATDSLGELAQTQVNVTTSFAGCGSTPPPNYAVSPGTLVGLTVGLILVIALLAVRLFRPGRRPPTPIAPAGAMASPPKTPPRSGPA